MNWIHVKGFQKKLGLAESLKLNNQFDTIQLKRSTFIRNLLRFLN